MWLHSSVGRASHWYRGGHGFESRWSPEFFRFPLSSCLNWKLTAMIILHFHIKPQFKYELFYIILNINNSDYLIHFKLQYLTLHWPFFQGIVSFKSVLFIKFKEYGCSVYLSLFGLVVDTEWVSSWHPKTSDTRQSKAKSLWLNWQPIGEDLKKNGYHLETKKAT